MNESFFLGALCFAIYLIAAVIQLHVIRFITPVIIVCLTSLIVYSLGFLAIFNIPIHFFHYSSVYWFLCLSFLLIFGAIYKSISLRILLSLDSAPHKREKYEVILEKYIKNQSYSRRVEILLEQRFASMQNGALILTNKGRRLAQCLLAFQKVFMIEVSG